jgi:hypothetical protein
VSESSIVEGDTSKTSTVDIYETKLTTNLLNHVRLHNNFFFLVSSPWSGDISLEWLAQRQRTVKDGNDRCYSRQATDPSCVLFEGERSSWPALVWWLRGARTCGRTSGTYKAVLIPDEMYLTLIVICAGDKRARALFCHTKEHFS